MSFFVKVSKCDLFAGVHQSQKVTVEQRQNKSSWRPLFKISMELEFLGPFKKVEKNFRASRNIQLLFQWRLG